jgi:transposase-like protein
MTRIHKQVKCRNNAASASPLSWHPFAEKFPLLQGEEWENFKESIKKTGGNTVPVIYRLVNGKKQGIDGRNRERACIELGLKCRMEKIDIADVDVKEFILVRNVHRRHLNRELRQQIVCELRADGRSTREIAETLGVHHSTVARDIQDNTEGNLNSGVANATPEGAAEHDPENSPGVANATPVTVVGRDGKRYRVHSGADTPQCPKIPKRLETIFASVPLFEKARRLAVHVANLFEEIEASPAFLKAVEGKKHRVFSSYFRTAAQTIELMTPKCPCPECGGEYEPSLDNDNCMTCKDRGYLTAEEGSS